MQPDPRATNPDPVLLTEVKRARRCFDALVSGRIGSVAELASLEGISDRCVSSLLPLALLACRPDRARRRVAPVERSRRDEILLMRSGGRSKISPSGASPISTSSASPSDDTLSALRPANQPVSTGYSSGCCVHQVGTAAPESKNDRSAVLDANVLLDENLSVFV